MDCGKIRGLLMKKTLSVARELTKGEKEAYESALREAKRRLRQIKKREVYGDGGKGDAGKRNYQSYR